MADRDILSDLVKPKHYNLELRNLDLTQWTYDGTVSIDVELTKSSKVIVINATELKFISAQILVNHTLAAESVSFDHDDKTQRVSIKFEHELPITQSATIIIKFQGVINDSLAGFYRSKYKPTVGQAASVARDKDGWHYVLSTQLQASYARRAFPCFDEPNLKATFDLSIEVPADQVALSNMPVKSTEPSRDGWVVASFETTPIMSTYLLTWAIGDFAYMEARTDRKHNDKHVLIRVHTVRGIQDQGEFALSIATKAIDLYSDLFGIPYPLEKMDILAVPEMSLFAMEGWGLITSQPAGVLFSEKTSDEDSKWIVAYNISHELAHQWFGNLVTMDWWDELWLNEGFATWLGFYAADYMFPELSVWAKFLSDFMESSFQDDGLRSSHAVHVPVRDGLRVHEIVDNISYSKGCAVVRMLVNYVGTETFMKGVSNYLKANTYGNASAQALWSSLDECSGKEVGVMAKSWINSVGYPVLTLTESPDGNEISVTQSRFLTSGDVEPDDDKTIWQVPLGIKGVENGRDIFLRTKQQVISGIDPEFYKLNADGTGFYRVNYPLSRLSKLSTQLDRLSTEDKVSMIGSTTALTLTGVSSTSSLLTFLQGFRQETHLMVWEQMLTVLRRINNAFSEDVVIKNALKRFKWKLIKDRVNELGMNDAPEDDYLTRSLRQTLQSHAVTCGHSETVDHFMPVFNQWAEKGNDMDPSVRRIAFRAAMQKNPAGTFSVLQAEFAKSTSTDVKSSILAALATTDDEEIIRQLVAFNFAASSSAESVSPSDMSVVLAGLADHPVGRHIQWQYLKDHWDAFTSKVSNKDMLYWYIQTIVSRFGTKEALEDIDSFFENKDIESFAQSLEQSKEGIRNRISYRERDSELLKQWLIDNGYTG